MVHVFFSFKRSPASCLGYLLTWKNWTYHVTCHRVRMKFVLYVICFLFNNITKSVDIFEWTIYVLHTVIQDDLIFYILLSTKCISFIRRPLPFLKKVFTFKIMQNHCKNSKLTCGRVHCKEIRKNTNVSSVLDLYLRLAGRCYILFVM